MTKGMWNADEDDKSDGNEKLRYPKEKRQVIVCLHDRLFVNGILVISNAFKFVELQ